MDLFAGCGKLNGEGRALARLTVDGDPPVVSPHGFLHDRQAKPRPPPGLFGGKKRLKDLRRMIGFDAMTGIGDFDGHCPCLVQASAERHRIGGCRAQAQRSTVRHGLKGILDQVIERFLHMLAVRFDWWKVGGQFGDASDVLAFAFRPEEAGTFS